MTTLTTHAVPEVGVASGPRARRLIKLLEGPRPALAALLAATAVLYIWGLSANGWANAYYAAAAQAGSESWKAWFFGSFDASNAITVDKTPASLWVMGLSARIFGVNSWSLLVPEALMGVATVAVLYAAVKRWHGPVAGLIAGAVLATTPVATLMFRFNNPDALLVLLLVGAAYATVRSLENASAKWLMFAGALVGFGFLTKMLQAFLVVPVLALVYLVAAPTGLGKRFLHLLAAGGALLVAGGWWVAIVELWPASSRPYIGGSQNNSILELTLGYNGLGRLTGEETGSVGGGGGGWGSTGWGRLFNSEIGGQIAWLLPAALILFVAGLVVTARAPRTDRIRASLLLWGGWLVLTGAVFSQMQGIFHAYYTVALAPAVGALVGAGAVLVAGRWRNLVLAGTLLVTVGWAYVLLGRSASFAPWLRPAVVAVGVIAAVAFVALDMLKGYGRGPLRVRSALPWVARVVAVAAIAAAIAAPLAYSVETAASAKSGSIPTAGPAVAGNGPGGGRGGGFPGGAGGRPNGGVAAPGGANGAAPGGANGGNGAANGANGTNGGANGAANGGANAGANGANGAANGANGGQNFGGRGGAAPGGMAAGGTNGATGTTGRGGGGIGGLLTAGTPSTELVNLLKTDADSYTWVAAAVGANSAAGIQLGTGLPVMAIGGFNGSDPAPTLEQFKQYVADGKIHYFIGGGGMRSNGGSEAASEIATWVAETYEAQTVGGVTIYDLS
jgi:4-amino-4-deoxy-L-arabinose transferase-like glycosyltransferase